MKHFSSLLLALVIALFSPAAMASEGGGHGGGGGEKAEVPAGPQFVPVGPLTVPIVRNGRIFQYVTIAVKLETKDGQGAEDIKARMPSLNDAYLSNLYGAFYVGEGMTGPLVDLKKIRDRLAFANSKVLPADTVQNILIQQVNQSRP